MADLGMAFNFFSDSSFMASMVSNRRPLKVFFISGNIKWSRGVMSGEYGGCGTRTVLFLFYLQKIANKDCLATGNCFGWNWAVWEQILPPSVAYPVGYRKIFFGQSQMIFPHPLTFLIVIRWLSMIIIFSTFSSFVVGSDNLHGHLVMCLFYSHGDHQLAAGSWIAFITATAARAIGTIEIPNNNQPI